MRKALIDGQGLVLNVIEIEPDANWSPPEGCVLMDGGEIGDTWDGTKFVKPELPISEPPTDWQAEWSKANTTTKKLDVLAKMLGLEKN